MSFYKYEALDETGRIIKGKLEGDHEMAVINRLKRMGYTPLEVNEVRKSPLQNLFQIRPKVKPGDLILFTRQLAAMLNAGIPLIRTLYALQEQTDHSVLKATIEEIARNVESGASFSESLKNYPEIFPDIYVDMVRSGEVGGNLVQVLERLSDQMDRDKALRDNIRTATFYPIVVLVFATLVLLGMMFFIVPVFVNMFPADVTLPLPTQVIILISNSLRGFWYFYLVAFIFLVFAMRTFFASRSGQIFWDRLKFRLPVFGSLFQKTTLARFARTFATLIGGGIPVLQALETAGPTSGSFQVEEVVRNAGERIQEGQSIAAPLRESKLFPPMVTIMIAVGEETGELSALLNRIAAFYEEEVATMAKGLTSLIEPILIIVVGGMVGLMVIALYLPMFTVITQIG